MTDFGVVKRTNSPCLTVSGWLAVVKVTGVPGSVSAASCVRLALSVSAVADCVMTANTPLRTLMSLSTPAQAGHKAPRV